MKTISEKWLSFHLEVLSDAIPDVEIIDMRRAFYAGAAALLSLMEENVAGVPDDEGVTFLEKIQEELIAFSERVGRGDA